MEVALPRIDLEASTTGRWEYCADPTAAQYSQGNNNLDKTVKFAKTLEWTPYDPSLNANLEQMWAQGLAYRQAMRWQGDKHSQKQSHCNTNTGQPIVAYEHNMVLGIVEYDQSTGVMIAMRRVGR